jgi:hypothetical protein
MCCSHVGEERRGVTSSNVPVEIAFNTNIIADASMSRWLTLNVRALGYLRHLIVACVVDVS